MAVTKALIINMDAAVPPIPVLFNPPEYQLQKSNNYVELGVPGLGTTLLQFAHGTAQALSMTLFFDTSDLGVDVHLATAAVLALTDLSQKTHKPPRLLFVWGTLVFPCVLEQVSQRLTYFNPAGWPMRAELDVTFRGSDLWQDALSLIPLQSTDKAKQHVVREGERLVDIAFEEADDPRAWRAVARANDIDNPLSLEPGRRLMIPRMT